MRGFARLLDRAARATPTPLLAVIRADLDRWRTLARVNSDYAAAAMLSTAIHHASVEIARREHQPKGNLP